MADIFLSYRRQDSQSATGRLADRLEEHFSRARVFRDHESIVVGEDFAEAIRRAVEASTVLLVILGPRWLGAADASGARRLDDPADFVRLEIELAFAADVAVVPVLVEGATMPVAGALPPSLAEFARCQALELSETRWRYDADRLIAALQSRFALESVQPELPSRDGSGAGLATRLATDLLDLATHPTRLIARRQTGQASDHVRAFAFLLGCIAAGNLGLVIGLDFRPSPSPLVGGAPFALLSWLLAGELVSLIVIAMLSAALTLAWRLTGPPVPLRRITLISAYLYGGVWLGFCGGALMLGAAAQLVEPGFFDRVVAVVNAAAHTASGPWRQVATLGSVPFHGPAVALVLIAFAIWLVTVAWSVVAWGAFRQAFGAGRRRAALATLLWLGMLGLLLWLSDRLG
ncbi:MAG TPA: toll/interleukin-1 receptor domain-containing protein [Caldimonas sp.]